MDLGLRGKVALVTAASKGLGRAVARALAEEGASLALCARERDTLEATGDAIARDFGVEVYTRPCDLADPEAPAAFVEAAAEHLGGVDILVNNTGGPPVATFAELTDDAWARACDLVLMSAARAIRAAVPHMRRRGGGRIVNITSVSVKQPIAGLMLSNAYRAAVVGMAKTLADELGPDGILINNVCPGKIATDRLNQLDEARAERGGVTVAEVRSAGQRAIPLGRYGQPEELAALVTFLASRGASYVTGTTILCDGGLYRGLM